MTGSRGKEREPTEQQRAILGFIRDYTTTHGWAPSIRELMPIMGASSTSTVSLELSRLVGLGLLRRGPGPRMLAVVDRRRTTKDKD